MIWKDLLNGSNYLPFWVFAIRATVLYFALIIATRWMRPRQVGILSGHNYLVAAGIVSLAAAPLLDGELKKHGVSSIKDVYAASYRC